MSHETTLINTFKCDSYACENEQVIAGQSGIDEVLEMGWALSENFLGQIGFDLCPDCVQEIQGFIWGKDK